MSPLEDRSNDKSNTANDRSSLIPYRENFALQVPTSGYGNLPEERSLRIADYWLMIRSRLSLIFAITGIVTTLVLIFVARQPDVYEAHARLQVDLENNSALGPTKAGSVLISNQGDDISYLNTQLLLLKSPAFLRRVVKTLNTDQDSNVFSSEKSVRASTWQNVLRMVGLAGNPVATDLGNGRSLRVSTIAPATADADIDESQKLEPYVAKLRSKLDVRLTDTTRLININFSHSDPIGAAKVTNVIADTFVQANWERRAASTSTASEFLQKRIAELQSKISVNEKRLIDYAKSHQNFALDPNRDRESDRLASLDKGLLEAENARKAAEADYQAALAPGAAAAIVQGSSQNLHISSLETRLADLKQRRAVMLLEAGENWPEVKELGKQIDLLEIQLKETRENAIQVVLTNLETKYRQALAREQALRKSFDQQHSATMNQSEAAIDYRMIQQETKTYTSLLDSLLQRSKENDVVLAATPNNVSVTDYATLPEIAVGPRRLAIVGLAFVLSLALSVAIAILLGSWEDSVPVDSIERVERLFAMPALAAIPMSTVANRHYSGIKALLERNGNRRPGQSLNGNSGSLTAEAYKKLRTAVLLSSAERAPRKLLFTSSLPGEGKTTAVINTGKVMSLTSEKVLLIDADLRRPTIHEILDLGNSLGLSTLLAADFSEAEALNMIQQYRDTNLYVLPAGPTPQNPAELLGSARMKRLLEGLESSFSHIIIDSPPVSLFTDAVLISQLADGVLLVVRAPKTPRQAARYSIQALDAVGAEILGVVLNAVKVHSSEYSYYRYYHR